MPTITPEAQTVSSFFGAIPVPGLSETPDSFVDVPSRYARQIGQYYLNAAAPKDAVSIMCTANSRCAGVNSIGNRLWSRVWSHGLDRWLWPELSGVQFSPADSLSRRQFGFDVTTSPTLVGSRISNVRGSGQDLSHFGFGSYSSTSEGPGGGMMMFGSGNAYPAYVRDMVNANLPSGFDLVFAAGKPFAGTRPISGDSKLVNSSPATMYIYYLKGPGFGTWRWEHVTASASNNAGAYTPEDPVNSSVDSSNPAVLSVTMQAADTIVGNTLTFDIAHVDLPDVQVGMAMYHTDGTDFGGISIVTDVTGRVVTLKWQFGSNPSTGDTLYFGEVSIGRESYTMPTTASEFRGVRHTSLTGLTFILGHGAEVDGPGFIVGTHGWSGHGYDDHLDEWPRDSWFGELCALMGLKQLIMHQAEQSSTPADMIRFADEVKAASPNTEIYLAGDPQHAVGSTVGDDYDDEIFGQSVYAGGSSYESQFCGDHLAAWEMGHKDNEAHPNMIGHSESYRPHLNIMGNLTPKTDSGSPLQAAARGVSSIQVSNIAVGRNS